MDLKYVLVSYNEPRPTFWSDVASLEHSLHAESGVQPSLHKICVRRLQEWTFGCVCSLEDVQFEGVGAFMSKFRVGEKLHLSAF